jgi:hypothetical protein
MSSEEATAQPAAEGAEVESVPIESTTSEDDHLTSPAASEKGAEAVVAKLTASAASGTDRAALVAALEDGLSTAMAAKDQEGLMLLLDHAEQNALEEGSEVRGERFGGHLIERAPFCLTCFIHIAATPSFSQTHTLTSSRLLCVFFWTAGEQSGVVSGQVD